MQCPTLQCSSLMLGTSGTDGTLTGLVRFICGAEFNTPHHSGPQTLTVGFYATQST
jgi:hypothetical protein